MQNHLYIRYPQALIDFHTNPIGLQRGIIHMRTKITIINDLSETKDGPTNVKENKKSHLINRKIGPETTRKIKNMPLKEHISLEP